MELIPRLSTRAAAGTPSYGMIPPLGSVQSASGLLVSQATAMGVAAVYACVRRRAADVARCPPSIYRLLDDGSRDIITDHPVAKLFHRPNRMQSWFEFAEQLMVGYLLRGNAYAAIIRDRRGDLSELIPMNPDAVMVLEASDGSIFYNVNRIGLWQIAMLRDFPVAIPAEDVLHLRGLTFNTLVAVSTIGLGRDAIGLSMGLEQQSSRWMGNGARPSGLLESPSKLTDQAARRLKAQWEQFAAGVENTGRTAVLEDGVVWKPIQLTSVDLEFMKQRDFQVLDVCRFFGVPPHKVWVVDRAASMSIPQQDQNYVNETIAPDLDRWEQTIERVFGLADEGLKCKLDERQLLRADLQTRRNAARLGVLSAITTPNEERRAEGLPAIPGADQLMVPANTAALGSDMTGTAPDGAGRPKQGQLPAPGVGTGGDQDAAGKSPEDAADDASPTAAYVPLIGRAVRGGPPTPQPINVNLALSLDPPRAKRIETTRDAKGNLSAIVIDEEAPRTKRIVTRRDKNGNLAATVIEEDS